MDLLTLFIFIYGIGLALTLLYIGLNHILPIEEQEEDEE